MSYTYLQEQGEESSAASFSDIPPYVLSRLNLTAGKSCSNVNATASCPSFQSGTMCGHSTADLGADSSMLCAEDSLVRTLAQPEKVRVSTANDQDCGPKCDGSLARYNPHSRSWKTRQCLLLGGLESYLETWPNWGLMRDGECLELATPMARTNGSEFGYLLPTPTATDYKRTPMKAQYANRPQTEGCPDDLAKWAVRESGLQHARLVPDLWEWAMGWPMMWTELKPVATDKFQQWLHSHGALSPNNETKGTK